MSLRFPIRCKLISIILIVLCVTSLFAVKHYFEMKAHNEHDLQKKVLQITQDRTKEIDSLIEKCFSVLLALSKHPVVIAKDSIGCDRLFAELLPAYPESLNILAAGMDGYNYCSGVYSPDVRSLNYNDREWFKRAKTERYVVGDLHISKLFKRPAVMIAVPVYDKRGRQIGVIGMPLDLQKIKKYFAEKLSISEGLEFVIIDSRETVVLNIPYQDMQGKKLIGMENLRRKFNSSNGTAEDRGTDGINRLYSFSTLSKAKWKVIVGEPLSKAYEHADAMGRNYILLLGTGAAIAVILALLISRRIVGNVNLLKKGINEFKIRNVSHEIILKGHDEFQDIATAFNRMAQSINGTEEKLIKSESFLNSVLEGIGEGVIVIDREFRIIRANAGYCRQVKKDCEDIIGKHCYAISHNLERPCYEYNNTCDCSVIKCFQTGEHHRSLHLHHKSDGSEIYIETNAYPLKDNIGNIVSVIETLIDVTDMVLLEKRLEEVKERYKRLYDEAPDMMHSMDKNGNIIVCNMTELKTLGYEAEEIIGKSFLNIIAPNERATCIEKFETLKKNNYCEGETKLLTKDGRELTVIFRAKAICDENGNFLMADAILNDITEKRTLEAQLRQAQKMEAIGLLAGGVAHDFNNMLTAIVGYGNLLQRRIGEDDVTKGYVQQILSAAEKASTLTKSLLAFSRKQIIKPVVIDLNEAISDMCKLLSRIVGEDIDLKTMLTDSPLTVKADRGQIEQVMLNLATNARDAMPEGGDLIIETDVVEFDENYIKSHGYGVQGRYALLTVTDTGTGMDDKTKEKIFEPFFTTKELGYGTGLGLSMVYGIVKQHNGFINVYSEVGKGTTFKVYLPLISEKQDILWSQKKEFALVGGTETILLAEDEPEVRSILRIMLQEAGYTVIESIDGEDVITKYGENKDRISLVIMDVIMPRRNGREAYEELRKLKPDLKVLFTSGYTANIIHKKGILDEGMNFLSKPIFMHELLKKVRELLDQ